MNNLGFWHGLTLLILSIVPTLRGKPSTLGFLRFIDEQDPEREIDHSDWVTCAVGDYLSTLGTRRYAINFGYNVLSLEHRKLHIHLATTAQGTYGELQESLNRGDV